MAQENTAAAPAASAQSQSRKDTKRIEAQIRQEKAKRSKPIQQKIDKAEKEIARLTDIQTACEAFLAQESAYSEENKSKLQETLAQLTETKVKLTQLEENWLQWQEELEQIQVDVEAEFPNKNRAIRPSEIKHNTEKHDFNHQTSRILPRILFRLGHFSSRSRRSLFLRQRQLYFRTQILLRTGRIA